jgi:recombination protein RecT
MKMAELGLYPSNTSGQAYVLPYKNSQKGLYEAQFQLGYQGLVTLFYRSGVKAIRSEIVREGDEFGFINGVIRHTYNVFDPTRHKKPAIGAYVIVELPTGGEVHKAMGKEEILNIGKKFSKSYDT